MTRQPTRDEALANFQAKFAGLAQPFLAMGEALLACSKALKEITQAMEQEDEDV